MNQDKALRKALIRKTDELPYGFDKRVMDRILLEAKKKSRREYYFTLSLVCFMSLAMMGGALFALYYYFSFNILHLFSGIRIPLEYNPLYGCMYIATLMLALLGLDHLFRQMVKKPRKG